MQYVYLIKSDKFHKIGIANDPRGRLSQLQTGNPYELQIDSCFGFSNAEVVEKALHQAFAKQNIRNEWFLLSPALLSTFDTICRLLGGVPEPFDESPAATDEVEEAEDIQEMLTENSKTDYSQMFSDGWKMAVQDSRGKYWSWKRSINPEKRETIYGGRISDLPYPIEKMRELYGGKS